MMKFLSLFCLLLIGCAAAEFGDVVLDDASNSVVEGFAQGMERTPSITEIVGPTSHQPILELLEAGFKAHMSEAMKHTLNDVMTRSKESMDHGREVARELIEKMVQAKEMGETLTERSDAVGEVNDEQVERLKGKLSHIIQKVMTAKNHVHQILEEINIESIIQKLKNHLLVNMDKETIKFYIRTVFGKTNRIGAAILEHIDDQGLGAVGDFLDIILPRGAAETIGMDVLGRHSMQKRWISEASCTLNNFMTNGWTKSKLQAWINNNIQSEWKEVLSTSLKYGVPALKFVTDRFCHTVSPFGPTTLTEQNSVLELWQMMRDVMGKFGQDVQEKVFLFANWIKVVVQNGISDTRIRVETLKQAVKQVIKTNWTTGKEVAQQLLRTLQPHKEELGGLWQQLANVLTTKP